MSDRDFKYSLLEEDELVEEGGEKETPSVEEGAEEEKEEGTEEPTV